MNKELIISSTLKELGVPADLKGYFYLKRAIKLIMQDNSLMFLITKRLYPILAEQFETTPSRVERAIRHAIDVCWNRGSHAEHYNLFGYTVSENSGKPTNSNFINTISDYLIMTLQEGE